MLQKCTPKRPYLTRSSIAKGASPVLHWLVFRKTMYAFFVFLNTNFWLPFSELQIAIRWVKKTLPGRHDVPPGGSQKTTEPEGNCMSEQVHPYAGAYAPKSYACAGHLQPSWGDPWPSWGDLGRPSAVLERSEAILERPWAILGRSDDTQTTGPDRSEGEKLREPEGENRLESTVFKPATSHRPRRAPREAPQTKQNRKLKRVKQEEDRHHELEQDKGEDEEDQ